MVAVFASLQAVLKSLPIFLAVTAAFALAERLWPAGPHKPLGGWLLNGALTLVYMFASSFAAAGSAALIAFLGTHLDVGLIDLRSRFHEGVLGGAAATLIWVAVFDFFYYWWHRLQHESGVLWRVHKLHHMDQELNVSTNNRHHWLEDLLRVPFILVPMAVVFKLDPAVAFVLVLWTVFIHANLHLHLGLLVRLIAGPQLHRIHHSRLPQHFNRNYAAFLPIWDQLFGTYYHPARGEFPPTGVDGEPELSTFAEGMILPFLRPRVPWKPVPPQGSRASQQ